MRANDEVRQFLSSRPTVTQIVDYQPSRRTQKRVELLKQQKAAGQLSPAEHAELHEYGRTVSFIQRLKERALGRVARV